MAVDGSNQGWAGPDGDLAKFALGEVQNTLNAYRSQPRLVREQANEERDTAGGGYAHRQLYELVQNSADAIADGGRGHKILVRLTQKHLYCADNGSALDDSGVTALMFSRLSTKDRSDQIGRFGLGFKSVLRVTDSPQFFSRSVSLRFSEEHAKQLLRNIVPLDRYPILRLPQPIDPHSEAKHDDDLAKLMTWATNIVRLPLKSECRDDIVKQMKAFPMEFLLFVDHVQRLTLDVATYSRDLDRNDDNGVVEISDGNKRTRWRCFRETHSLSADAMSDNPLPVRNDNPMPSDDDNPVPDDNDQVAITWAAPVGRSTSRDETHGRFWAYFPTSTPSLVAGILNAPWKTNEDRGRLLPGVYNSDLIAASARLMADSLPLLSTADDPAKHLEMLPPRQEQFDSAHGILLRKHLSRILPDRKVVPDQDGRLRLLNEVKYPPAEVCRPLSTDKAVTERQAWDACSWRPKDWLHHSAFSRERIRKIDRLYSRDLGARWAPEAPRETVKRWLSCITGECTGDQAVAASRSAILIASLIYRTSRGKHNAPDLEFGKIVLTADESWLSTSYPLLFLPDATDSPSAAYNRESDSHQLHPGLAGDLEVVNALSELGVREKSAPVRLEGITTLFLKHPSPGNHWNHFWQAARDLSPEEGREVVLKSSKGRSHLVHVRTLSGEWEQLGRTLMPGKIVPPDASRDDTVAIDCVHHEKDLDLLRALGAAEGPRDELDLTHEGELYKYYKFEAMMGFMHRNEPKKPKIHLLDFESTRGPGHLEIMKSLSLEARVKYTSKLLDFESTYKSWLMQHTTVFTYRPFKCESLAVEAIKHFGYVKHVDEFVPFSDLLGQEPKNPAALRGLLRQDTTGRVRKAFDLTIPTLVAVGREERVPLTDEWPGLSRCLDKAGLGSCYLVRCQGFEGDDDDMRGRCEYVEPDVYLVDTGDERADLKLVLSRLNLQLHDDDIEAVLLYVPPEEIKQRRSQVKDHATDAERLLAAVGMDGLRSQLPSMLLDELESDGEGLTGLQVADAAIATFHTGALKTYRSHLGHLDPPRQWAGSRTAVEFVLSLGFTPEWAGERGGRRPPFLEVEAPYDLPPLHNYQETIRDRVVDMLVRNGEGDDKRGMISLPTGSGKTRVAVQAVVEAMLEGFNGTVLWVADRDELCEQAVQAWRQVWSAIAKDGGELRISRMWAGQRVPPPTDKRHVVVATIQTLRTKLVDSPTDMRFAQDIALVVFDEAHRSVAPSYTAVMEQIGLTRWKREEEPYLLGLTATPYRGRDEKETARLASRFGRNRLDSGVFRSDKAPEAIRELQDMRVLARAEHRSIKGVSGFSLTEAELVKLHRLRHPGWLPRGAEERIARDTHRTRRIIEEYKTHVSSAWSTLIFATSVAHAQTIAALLNQENVVARSVSARTDPAIRRRIVDQFRNDEIKVLVNYGVFTEGFDAPNTRVIMVARPVYSPNLYFQMIGRGLRGPENGGNERSLIINVRDNIENFERQLAFSDLDWLWES